MRGLETNLIERIAETREHVWLGELTGLPQTLVSFRAEAEHAERLAATDVTDTAGAENPIHKL